ncbi:TonB-dependent receptor [Herbaspirillum lusitanum]|uniref:TonB-dependent receptor n=1 Tax=Herbaspirillum lusitanum TaxID=213312 RepID=A0ABW9AG69_9BURK
MSLLTWGALSALYGLSFAPAFAQSAPDASGSFTVPEVKVTAERRETDIQKTAVAVSVVNKEDIVKPGILLFNDLSGQVPGFVAPVPTPGTLYIRGIGTSSPTYYPAVALYVDDVYIPRIRANKLYASFADVERIEVLRGPQGTLYGQNSSAGAFKLVSKDPVDERSGWVSVSAGNYGALGVKGYATGAINPGILSASVAYTHEQDDGYTKNPTLGRNTNSVSVDQLRAKFRLTPSPGLEAILSIDGTHDGSSNGDYSPINYRGGDPRTSYEEKRPEGNVNIWGTSLRINKNLDDKLTLKSITAYRGFREMYAPNLSDGLPTATSGFILGLDQHQFSQEFQLLADYGRFNYTLGAVLFNEHFSVDRPQWTNSVYSGTGSVVDNQSYGVFAQGNYKLTEKLGVTAGLRFNHFDQTYSAFGYSSNVNYDHVRTVWSTNGDLKTTSTAWTPKLGIDYQWNPDLFSYASVTRGQKDGGYNPVAASLQIAQVPVSPEKVTSYEIGTKASSFGGRLKTNVALFYNQFDGYQAAVANPVVNGVPIFASVTVNAGKATTYGAELEASVYPSSRLEFNFSAAVLHAEFDEFSNPTGAANTDYKGKTLPFSPKLTLGTRIAYKIPLQDAGTIRLNASARYLSQIYTAVDNAGATTTPAQTYVNLGGSYTSQDAAWTTSLEVTNLFDRTYPLNFVSTPSVNVYSARYNAPRTIRLALRRDF